MKSCTVTVYCSQLSALAELANDSLAVDVRVYERRVRVLGELAAINS